MLALPVTLVSLYYQWRIVKKWCTICLGIIFTLYAEIVVCSFYYKDINTQNFKIHNSSIIIFLFSFALPLIIWLTVKPFLNSFFKLKTENKLLFKFKRTYFLFKYALTSERKVNYQNLQSKIYVGNKNAQLKISIITSPMCKFCADTHLVIDELIKKYGKDIHINILFFFNPNKKYDDYLIDLHFELVRVYLEEGEEKFMESLGYWFANKDYKKWFKKYGNNNSRQSKEIKKILTSHYTKNIENEVSFTPSIFVGEYSFPNIYDKEDIKLYVPDLLEDTDVLI